MPSTHDILCVLLFVALYVALCLYSIRRGVKHAQKLQAHGWQSGWVTVDPAQVPPAIAPHVHWQKPSLVMRCPSETGDVWFVWHRLTRGSTRRSGTVLRRLEQSRFIAAVPSSYPLPTVAVKRRSGVSASIVSARGLGTSADGFFDRSFTIRPVDRSARAFINPALRAALVSGALPPFELHNNLVWIDYWDWTTPGTLDYRAQTVAALPALLVAGPRVGRQRGAQPGA
jgi:hypothetical protein